MTWWKLTEMTETLSGAGSQVNPVGGTSSHVMQSDSEVQ